MHLFILIVLIACSLAAAPASQPASVPLKVEQWGRFEVALPGPREGNPFLDVELSATFTWNEIARTVRGFYDGDGVYRIRFMPPAVGVWRFVTRSNRAELNGRAGELTVTAPSPGNHGPVRVAGRYHFAYADGTAFVPIGTTCYAWVHQPEALEQRTLATLKASPFNKVRMCVFPTAYKKGGDEPPRFPFERSADGAFDHARFNVAFFRHLEQRIAQLGELGVEADVILFHPYDKGTMGFDRMPAGDDDRYVHYLVARLSAYRNVWWSMANEFDLMHEKHDVDFDRLFQILQADDPADHLRSIHFSARMYDSSKPWITHLSVQNGAAVDDFGRASLYRDVAGKPVIYDEARYEGNIERRWGQLSAEQMVEHCWLGTIGGTFVGHGEVLRDQSGESWTSRGGELRGQSAARIAFLKSILTEAPPVSPIDRFYETHVGGRAGEFYLVYFGSERPAEWAFQLPRIGLEEGMTFRVDVLDTWNMTSTPVEGPAVRLVKQGMYAFAAEGERKIALPGRPWMALRIVRVGAAPTTAVAPVNEAE
ncbi:MAG TPA: DUF5060 domain-containing protein [Tepidisphaeraceae bacterium]|nr:DUF5060 domain-containing protein [Tepidisphaeraceae bacterium]